MFVAEFFCAVVVALVLTGLLSAGGRRYGRGIGALTFFVIILLAGWSGGLWLKPLGPAVNGVYVTPYIISGVVAAFFLAALVPARRKNNGEHARNKEAAAERIINTLVWLLVVIFCLAILLAYTLPGIFTLQNSVS